MRPRIALWAMRNPTEPRGWRSTARAVTRPVAAAVTAVLARSIPVAVVPVAVARGEASGPARALSGREAERLAR